MSNGSLDTAVLTLTVDGGAYFGELTKAKKGAVDLRTSFDKIFDAKGVSLSGLGKELEAFSRQAQAAGSSMTKILTLPVLGFGGAVLKASVDFETAFAGVKKTISGTPEQMAKLNAEIREMAKSSPVSAVGIAAIAESAGQLGVGRDKITAFTKTIIDISTVTKLTAEEAGTSFAKLSNVMHVSQDQFKNLGSAVYALGNFGASTEQEMLGMAQRIAAAGASAGLTAPQVLGISNALASVGIEAEAGGTAVSRVITKIAGDVATGSGHLEDFARVAGMSSQSFQESWGKNAGETLTKFFQGLAGLKDKGESLFMTMDELGFKEVRLRNAMLSAANAGTLMADSIKVGNDAFSDTSRFAAAAEERYNTTANALKNLWNRVNDVAITFGNGLTPVLNDGVKILDRMIPYVDRMAKAFAGLSAPARDTLGVLAGSAAVAGPALIFFGSIARGASDLIKLFGGAGGLVTVARTARTALIALSEVEVGAGMLGMLATAGPWGIAAAAAIAIVGKQFDHLKQQLEDQKAVLERAGTPIPWVRDLADAKAAAENAQKPIGELRSGIFTLADAQKTAAEHGQDLVDGMEITVPTFAKMAAASVPAVSAFAQLGEEMKAARAEIAKLSKSDLTQLTSALNAGTYSLEELHKKTGVSEMALKILQDRLKGVAKDTEDAEVGAEKVRDAIAGITDAVGKLQDTVDAEEIADQIDQVKGTFASLEAQLDDTAEKADLVTNALDDIAKVSSQVLTVFQTPDKTFGQSLKDMFDLKKGGNIVGGLNGIFQSAFEGGGGVKGAAKSFATNAIAGLTDAIPVVGPIISQFSGAIVAGFSKIFKLGTAGRDAIREFATGQGGFEPLHKQLAALGAEGEQMWIKLTQGVGRNDAEGAKAAIKTVTDALDAARSTVTQASTDLATIEGKMGRVTEISPELQAALDAATNAKNPEQHAAALANIGSIVDATIAKQDHLSATLQEVGLDWTEAGEKFKTAKIAQESGDLVDTFEEIAGAGVDINHEMAAMGPKLNDFVKDAKKAGVEVPLSMQKVLQTAIDSGVLYDENGKKIEHMGELGLTFGGTMESVSKTIKTSMSTLELVLRGLAKYLGVDLPAAAEDGADGVQDAFDRNPPVIRPRIDWPTDEPPDYGGAPAPQVEGSARGSMVMPWGLKYLGTGGMVAALSMMGFAPRGTDVIPAMLTPGEGVVNTVGMADLGEARLSDLNHGLGLTRGNSDVGLEREIVGLRADMREELELLRAAVLTARVTSLQANNRELVRVIIDTLDQNPEGLRTNLLEVLQVRS